MTFVGIRFTNRKALATTLFAGLLLTGCASQVPLESSAPAPTTSAAPAASSAQSAQDAARAREIAAAKAAGVRRKPSCRVVSTTTGRAPTRVTISG